MWLKTPAPREKGNEEDVHLDADIEFAFESIRKALLDAT
jgi:hypothetical protein